MNNTCFGYYLIISKVRSASLFFRVLSLLGSSLLFILIFELMSLFHKNNLLGFLLNYIEFKDYFEVVLRLENSVSLPYLLSYLAKCLDSI